MLRITLAARAALAFTPAQALPHHVYVNGGSEYYTNVSGHRVHRPLLAGHKPAGASAHCRDGSWSFSEHHQGTCSHHGGVAEWE
jgi:hypothetical protein